MMSSTANDAGTVSLRSTSVVEVGVVIEGGYVETGV